ncbi:hypothetical protein E2C01_059346 [Portunus trituberculatus]|uniref:Uncharacterized protein n=1 Tax=Portunus trituberculatus TaxID=210409 RepID=A0A5B7H8U6_PORTR|nr:hypothetical protein [Portunus trituberculatus]
MSVEVSVTPTPLALRSRPPHVHLTLFCFTPPHPSQSFLMPPCVHLIPSAIEEAKTIIITFRA